MLAATQLDEMMDKFRIEERERYEAGVVDWFDIDRYFTNGFEDARDIEFDSMVKESSRQLAVAEAKHVAVLAEAQRRRAFRRSGFRSAATWVSNLTGLSKGQCGGQLKRAQFLANTVPLVNAALAAGEISVQHANKICSVGMQFAEEAERDQAYFLRWSKETWPFFARFMDSWAELMDDTDPQDLLDAAHKDRRMIWAQGVGHTMLVELSIPNECFEVLLVSMRPIYDRLLEIEWADARLAVGDDATFTDLARTDRQRWVDSLMELVRRGAASNGHAPDPGIRAILNVTIDRETLERELKRFEQDPGSDQPLPAPNPAHAEQHRCHTASGLPVSPALAVRIALTGAVRRFVITADNLDFRATATTRLFKGSKRLGLVIRDYVCRGPGCDTPATRCEADHIRESSSGGLTIPSNGQMLCRPCHRHKTQLYTQGLAWPVP